MNISETYRLIECIPDNDKEMIDFYEEKARDLAAEIALDLINSPQIFTPAIWQKMRSRQDIEGVIISSGSHHPRAIKEIAAEIADRMFIQERN